MARTTTRRTQTMGNGTDRRSEERRGDTRRGRDDRGGEASRAGRGIRLADDAETHDHRTAKVIELVASSSEGFEQAIANAVEDASATTRGITGLHVETMSVRCHDGRVVEYRVHCKVAFGVEHTPRS